MMQYREVGRRFEFREIEFPEDKDAVVSEANPKLCLTCHGQDPRPNWEAYATWPGAYGSNDDEISEEVLPHLKRFLERAETHPRYRFLVDLQKGFERQSPDYDGSRTVQEHNINLSARLTHWNFRRLSRILEATPDWNRYKYAVLGVLLCHDFHENRTPLEQFFPESFWPLLDGTPRKGEPYVLQMRNLTDLFARRGISTKKWAMSFRFAPQSFQGPSRAPMQLASMLLEDPDLKPFFEVEWEAQSYHVPSPWIPAESSRCYRLANRSREALAALSTPIIP
jgi:hypothetical protein